MADKIIKLKLDTSQGDASIKASEVLLAKLKAQIAAIEAELKKVDPKPIQSIETAVSSAIDAAKEPIKLDVNTDKAKIDALIASLGSAKKEAAALAALTPVINVSTNADQVSKELRSIDLTGAEVPVVVEAVGLDAVKDDISAVAADVPHAEVSVEATGIDAAKLDIASVSEEIPSVEVPIGVVGIDEAKQEISSISVEVPPVQVPIGSVGVEDVKEELSSIGNDVPAVEVPVGIVGIEEAKDQLGSVGDDVPTIEVPVESVGVDHVLDKLDNIEPEPIEVPIISVGIDHVQKELQEIDAQPEVHVKVTTNIPEVKPVVEDFKNDIKELSFEQKIELAIDASKAAKSLTDVKNSQKELQSLLLQSDEGSDSFNRLAQAAGEGKDRINDVNDAIRKLSKSPIENLSGGFKSVKQSLLDLNFAQFNKDVTSLGVASKKVSFKDLSSSVVDTGKSFLSLGKIILANPIGLIATIVTLIISNFDSLKSSLSGLAPVFEFIGDVIGGVVDALKNLGDAIGLTSFASDEASKKALDSAKKNFEDIDKAGERELALLKARGKDTVETEVRINQEKVKANEKGLFELSELSKRKGKLTDDEIKQQEELIESNRQLGISIDTLTAKRATDLDAAVKAAKQSLLSPVEAAKAVAEEKKKANKESIDAEIAAAEKAKAVAEQAAHDALLTAENFSVSSKKIDQDVVRERKEFAAQQERVVIESNNNISKLKSDLTILDAAEDAKVTKVTLDEEKKRHDEFKKNNAEREKLIKEETNFQTLLAAKKDIPTDDITSLRVAVGVNKELQKIEETRIDRKLESGRITIADSLKEKEAVKSRFDEENDALARTIELRNKLSEIDISIEIGDATSDAKLADLTNRIDKLNEEKVTIEADIKENGSSDELVAKQEQVNNDILTLQREFEAESFQQAGEALQKKTEQLLAERKNQEQILSAGSDSEGAVLSDEEKEAIAARLAAIDAQVAKNKEVSKSYEEIASIISRTSDVAISGVDRSVIAEVKRIEALKESGQAVSELEQAFLDANENAEIDVRIKSDTAALDETSKKLNDLQKQLDTLDPTIDPEKYAELKEQTEQANADFLAADSELKKTIKEKNEEEGSALANSLGLTEDQLESVRDQLIDAAFETAKLLGDISIEADQDRLEKEFEARSSAIEETNNVEVEALQRRLDKGQITQEQFDKKKAESDKKAKAEKLKLDKDNFEKEKKIKIKQLRIELALEIGRIWASYAVLPPGASAIGAAIQSAVALASFGLRSKEVSSQTFEQGGVISDKGPAASAEPFHGQVKGRRHKEGGEKFMVRNSNHVAELEKDEIVIRRSLAIRDKQKLLAYNAGHIKLFEGGGSIGDSLNMASNSFISAAGDNINMPVNVGHSPIGFVGQSEQPNIIVEVSAFERVQNQMSQQRNRAVIRR